VPCDRGRPQRASNASAAEGVLLRCGSSSVRIDSAEQPVQEPCKRQAASDERPGRADWMSPHVHWRAERPKAFVWDRRGMYVGGKPAVLRLDCFYG